MKEIKIYDERNYDKMAQAPSVEECIARLDAWMDDLVGDPIVDAVCVLIDSWRELKKIPVKNKQDVKV